MFRKLRLKLMLVNLSVIFLLFILLIAGTYFFVQDKMLYDGESMMNRLSHDLVVGKIINPPPDHDLDMGKPTEFPPDHSPSAVIFFIKTNLAGDVIQTSAFIPLTKDQISLLAVQTQEMGGNKGSILFDQTEYFYQITPIADNQGVFIVFHDFQHERHIFKELVAGLTMIGIICMILSLFGSLFMANKAMIPIKKAWQQQNNFLADASRELRTPLTIIQTTLELVCDNPEETVLSQEHWLSNIYDETLCMTKLVESLLFLARADSHQQLLSNDDFPLNQTIIIVAELFRPFAALQGVTLDVQVKTHLPYCGDEAKLRQVVGILLDNAIHHTPAGGQITIKLENSKQGILLSVVDTGEGINPEHIEKIFERFYQSHSSSSRGGTGLGLSIAKCIIESHNGSIHVISTPGKGSIFTILLPHLYNMTLMSK